MYIDKKKLYITSILLFVLLSAILFVPFSGRITAAVLLLAGAVLTCVIIKKRKAVSFNKTQVLMLMSVIGATYVALYYLSGLYFGFHRSEQIFSLNSILNYIIPISVIIVTSEIIRVVLLAQEDKVSDIFSYLSAAVAQMLIFYNFSEITSYFKFMDFVGMVILPALISGAAYHSLAKNFGCYPNIAFRLITTLYPFIIPYEPAVPDAIDALVRLLLPLIAYMFISALYIRKVRKAKKSGGKAQVAVFSVILVLMISLVMLISCKFRFGALVIATESMTGEINKGDAVIYDSYDGKTITEGQIIVFEKRGALFVHRVDMIENINGTTRFYTKGDANDERDDGYITASAIVGTVEAKVPFVGYPTIWLNSLFHG